MTETYYGDALKLGQKEYRACVDAGVEPCLPAFDDIVSRDGTATGVDLGLVQVPAEFIVGTKTKGRTTSFARNFMPLLAENTEFATKWEKLCQAHLKEGIRDPIKVYEYMNRFYVEEGNKRVSVLKFFGAVVISAHVTRILPEQNGETENEIYYEFVSFYRYSKVNFIEFSKKGSYAKLQTEMGKEAEEAWTDEDRSRFKKVYYAFREAYEAKGGKKLDSTVGDAMLAYIKVYGYEALCDSSIAEIKKNIAKMWEEVALQQEESPIELKLTPPEEKKPSILARVLPVTGSKTLHVAFLYDKNPETSGWTNGHDLGRQHVQTLFNGQIITETYLDVMEDDPQSVLEQVIAEGNNVVFTTSPRLLPASLRAAVDHPDVTIMNCSLNTSHRYVRTYYARMYEVKFITGVIAGTLTEDGRVGYVCDYPIFGQIAGINAFALGVQMVNPRAKVYLEWSSIGGGKSAIQRLTDRGIQSSPPRIWPSRPTGTIPPSDSPASPRKVSRCWRCPSGSGASTMKRFCGVFLTNPSRTSMRAAVKPSTTTGAWPRASWILPAPRRCLRAYASWQDTLKPAFAPAPATHSAACSTPSRGRPLAKPTRISAWRRSSIWIIWWAPPASADLPR